MQRLWVLVFVVLAMHLPLGIAQAQVPLPAEDSGTTLEALVEQAEQEGYQILLVPRDSGTSATAEGAEATDMVAVTSKLGERARDARLKFSEIVQDLPLLPGHLDRVVHRAAEDSTPWWPLLSIAAAGLFLLIGYLASRLQDGWLRERFKHLYTPHPQDRSDKIAYLLLMVVMRSLAVITQVAIASLLMIAVTPDDHAWRTAISLIILGVGVARVAILIFQALIVPYVSSHRLLHLSDADALSLFKGFVVAIWVAVPITTTCMVMDAIGIDRRAHILMLVVATLLSALFFIGLVLKHRQAIAGAILGPHPEQQGLGVKTLAGTWHAIAILYLAGAWLVTTVRLLLDQPGALGPIMAPLIYGVLALATYGIVLLFLDRVLFRPKPELLPPEPETEPDAIGDEAGLVDPAQQASAEPIPATPPPPPRKGMKDLAEHAAVLFILAAYLLAVVNNWFGVAAEDSPAFAAIKDIILVAFIAYLAFQAVKVKVDNLIQEEGGDDGPGEPGDEGGKGGASRLATLLPIFRNFLLAIIATIAGMIVLSELGVDIAPLFAGAGVVGIAVGFGAQTLIRDIFSGAFFLMDDAFRKGEYIEISGTRGTVEKISIRSMQMRHHLGPLHTIPFGEITTLTNYSRDWVMMKLPLRLTYDTDLEQVRKLIKQLGKELLSHPEVGENFLQPLKSQGVQQMEDSAMIVRVKYMTKPGDQFQVRKIVYARIRELFEEHGIKFASREVTVRLAEQPDRPLTEEDKTEIAGAVRPLLDEETQAGAGQGQAEKDAR